MPLNWHTALDQVVNRLVSDKNSEYGLDKIVDLVGPPSIADLAKELSGRIERGEIQSVYRVLSPETKSGIGEYARITDLPDSVYDQSTDRNVPVQLRRNVELVYKAA